MLPSGARLGPYEVISFLAKGGMGEVYIARDHRLDRDVAVKILGEQKLGSIESMARFEREAKALAALSHPNILTIYDIGNENNVSFVVMELLNGESLRSVIRRGPIPVDRVRNIVISIAEGLAAAHSKGIIHRDLKPENIFITNEGRIKILDFGLARIRSTSEMLNTIESSNETQSESWATQSWATQAGSFVGTVPYMSPEQIQGKSIDTRSDIFSTGVLLYEMTTGSHPFTGKNMDEVIRNILKAPPKSDASLQSNIPNDLESTIRHCLEKNPDNRFQTADELLRNLKSQISSTDQSSLRSRNRTFWIAPAALVLIILIVVAFLSRPKVTPVRSIAILPFVNRTSEPDLEYLSDGIADRIISDISQIETLKVMGSGTVFSYKNQKIDSRKIGNELKVDAIASGSITRQGESIVVQVELIRVSDGFVLWKDQYERRMAGILEIQADVSNKVSEHLKLKLTGQQLERISKRMTNSPEAYENYLRGRYFWTKFSPEDQRKSIEYFKRAIEKDPQYSLAWAGLSDSYGSMATNGWLPPSEAFPMAKTAALKAIELKPDLAEAHHSLGAILFFYERDWRGSEQQFQQAIQLNPSFADAYCVYSYLLSAEGRAKEGLNKVRKAVDIDPLNLKSLNDLAYALYSARDFNGAQQQINKVLEIDPNYEAALNSLVYVYSAMGRHDLAIESGLKALEISQGSSVELGTLGYAYGLAGKRKEANDILDKLRQKAQTKTEYVSDFYFGHVYTGLGEKDKAFEWLFKACRDWHGDWGMLFIQSQYSDSLRSDPRFNELLRCMKF